MDKTSRSQLDEDFTRNGMLLNQTSTTSIRMLELA